MSDHETSASPVVEPVKPPKLKKIKSAALSAGFYGIPVAFSVAAIYFGARNSKMQFDTAKLNLEAAKLNLNK